MRTAYKICGPFCALKSYVLLSGFMVRVTWVPLVTASPKLGGTEVAISKSGCGRRVEHHPFAVGDEVDPVGEAGSGTDAYPVRTG